MKILYKKVVRSSVSTLLLITLLVLSITVTTTSYSALVCAEKQYEAIDVQYTTVAIPSGENQANAGSYYVSGIDSKTFKDGSKYIGPLDAENTAKASEHFKSADHRILLGAHVDDGIPVASGTLDPLDYSFTLDTYCYQLSVMALRCVSIETDIIYEGIPEEYYVASFEIVDTVCGIDAYDLPPYEDVLYIEAELYTRDNQIPFEIGKTYLVRGRYKDYSISRTTQWVSNAEGVEQIQWVPVRDVDGTFGPRVLLFPTEYPLHTGLDVGAMTGVTNGLPNWIMERLQDSMTGEYYYTTPENNCWPYYAEYEGNWQDFLETENGKVWKNEIIPYFEMNHSSVPVILTDDIQSMYSFNTGDVSILDGSTFSDADYRSGNPVCLVSAAYAKVNSLSVGDTINLDFYHTSYEVREVQVGYVGGRSGVAIVRSPLTSNTRIDVQKDYTIVGIYTGPNWPQSSHGINADTILVPKASVPDADKYTGPSMPLLNTVIIENGSIDAFEAHMAANDKAGAYLYFDQGYTEAAASVQTLIDNAKRIMIVGISMFILSSLLFLLLFIRRTAPVVRTMRLLGVSAKKTWLEFFVSLIWQVVIAVLIGNALAIVLYDRITQMVLSASLELSYGSVALCGAVQFLVLFVAGMIWTRSVANRNLMQKR